MERVTNIFILQLILVWLLTGCGGGAAEPPPSPTPGPEDGAREWIDALTNQDGNKMLKHTCLAQRESLEQTTMWTSAFSVLTTFLSRSAIEVKGDISDLKFETLSQSDDKAEVRVFGELRVAVSSSANAYQVDEKWEMVKENDTWRWCGSNSGVSPLVPTDTPVQQIAQDTPTPVASPTLVSTPSNVTPLPALEGQFIFVSNRDDPDPQNCFESQNGCNMQIYMMNANGTDLTRLSNDGDLTYLTSDFNIDSAPDWLRDGQQITFASKHEGNFEIYVINADGSGLTRLTNNLANDLGPIWSPDGQQIVFTSDRDGNSEIYVMNADGSNQIRLTNNSTFDSKPTWSPDGQQIAFVSNVEESGAEIYVINTDGTNQTRLTDNQALDDLPTWSPDGDHIAFHSQRDNNGDIFVMNADGSNQTRVNDIVAYNTFPVWSPDSSHIAFMISDGKNADIYVMNPDGTGLTPLIEGPSIDLPLVWLSN